MSARAAVSAGSAQPGNNWDYPHHGKKAFATDNAGNLYQQDDDGNIARMSLDGTVTGRLLRDTGQGRLYGPDGVDVGPDGNIYVSSGNEVQVFAPDGTFVRRWPAVFPGVSTRYAIDLACDSLGHVYLAVNDDGLILKCDLWGNLLGSFGSLGTGPGQFQYPYAVAVDKQGDVYVAEKHSYRIQKFTPAGELVQQFGSPDYVPLARNACSLAVDSDGNVYSGDAINHRVQKYGPTGELILSWGTPGTCDLPSCFCGISGIDVDCDGNIWVADRINNRVQEFTQQGSFLGKWGSGGQGLGQFWQANGIAADGTGRVYIVDRMQGRIQVLARPLEHPTCGAARMGSLAGSQVTIRGQVVTASVTDLGDCFLHRNRRTGPAASKCSRLFLSSAEPS